MPPERVDKVDTLQVKLSFRELLLEDICFCLSVVTG